MVMVSSLDMDPDNSTASAKPDSELPEYSPDWGHAVLHSPRELVAHTYSLTDKHGRAWFKLNIQSKALSTEFLPHLVEGSPIKGSVDLDLTEETSVKSVKVVVSTLMLCISSLYGEHNPSARS